MTDGCAILHGVLLDAEQEGLLGTLVEGAAKVADRSERVFDLIILDQGTFVSGPGLAQGGLPVEDDDIPVLEQAGFLRVLSRGRALVRFRVTPEGQEHYEARAGETRGEQPRAAVEEAAPSEVSSTARPAKLAAYRKSAGLRSDG